MSKRGVLFLVLFGLVLMCGCGNNGQNNAGSSSDQTKQSQLPTQEDRINQTKSQNLENQDTIVVWHYMTDRAAVLDKLALDYEKQTGVKVKFELYAPTEIYSQKVRAAAQTNTLPDVFSVLGEKRELASFIKAGYIANIASDLEKDNSAWKNTMFSKAIEMDMFEKTNAYGVEPGYYGVPLDMMNIQMVYNKKLFRKAGLDAENPPKTWSEFIDAVRKLRKAGIQPLIGGWSEIWMIDCLASNFAYNIMGDQKIIATIKGEVPYTDKDWVKVFELFDELRKEDAYASGIVAMVNKRAELLFATERAAIAFNGSWCVNVYSEMNPNLEYGAMLVPKISDKFPINIWGGAGVHFMVNAKSFNKVKALAFLKWLTEEPQQAYYAKNTKNLPANKDAVKDIPVILRQFADDMDNINHPRFLPVQESPVVIETFDKGIQSIIIGEKTPLQLAEELVVVKKREMQKSKTENN